MPNNVIGVLGGNHTSVRVVASWLEDADLIIAADGGFLRCLEAGYVPDVVLGDFDSVPASLFSDDLLVIRDEAQDITDCAKLLEYCHHEGHRKVVLTCTEGDLMDHQLDAIHSAAKSEVEVTFALERGIGVILKPNKPAKHTVENGARVSLIPIADVASANLTGVEWKLTNQPISALGQTSISNRATETTIEATIDSGSAYLFIEGIHQFHRLAN